MKSLFNLCLLITFVEAQGTIPFKLGNDYRIYIKATINNSEPLDFIFDTGANAMVANTTKTDSKLNLEFDGNTENTGANGITNQKVSSSNTIRIGEFERKNEELIGVAYPGSYVFDGVIGYPFFEDYLVEINYELQKLILHQSNKTVDDINSYEKLKMTMTGEVPFIDFSVFKAEEEVEFPVMIDTGFNGTLIVYHKIASKFDLGDQYEINRIS
ncbi:aspartyl protease family protein [Psychroserpens sp.]